MATIDSFERTPPAPTQVNKLDIWLIVEDAVNEDTGEPERKYAGRYEFAQLDANGRQVATRAGSLVPHLTPQQRTQVMAFLDTMLAKARTTVEP